MKQKRGAPCVRVSSGEQHTEMQERALRLRATSRMVPDGGNLLLDGESLLSSKGPLLA